MSNGPEAKQRYVNMIREKAADLNDLVKSAAFEHGLTTEFILSNINDPNAFYQRITAAVSERL